MANFIPGGSSNGGSSESVVERQAKINDACSSFIQLGFRLELFTINNLHNYGYTEDEFLELIEPISSSNADLDSLRHCFNSSRQLLYNGPSVTPPNKFSDFIEFMKWMKSVLSAGIKKEEMSKADVALAKTLVDSAAPLMQEQKRIEDKIDELKNDLTVRVIESVSISAELKLKLGPIYGYKEPSISELRRDSYLLYEEDCRTKGITPMPEFDELGLVLVVDTFGGIAKERHLIKFLNDPVRKELIETYLKGFAPMGGDGF